MNRTIYLILAWQCFLMSAGVARGDEPARRVWIADLLNPQQPREIRNSPHVDFGRSTSGGVSRPAIFHHANAPGSPLAEIVFPDLALPELDDGVERIDLRVYLGIRDGKEFNIVPGVDGVRFVVRIGEELLLAEEYREQRWREHRIDLSQFAGNKIGLSLVVDPLKTSAADWALWGEPRIFVEGSGGALKRLAEQYGQTIPLHWPIAERLRRFQTNRIVRRHEDAASASTIATTDEALDLPLQLAQTAEEFGPSLVPLAPAMAVGQGEDPNNHTLVRVLNRWGIAEAQFLAYGPAVRGGVWVEAARGENLPVIVAAPIVDDSQRILHLFNRYGGQIGTIRPGAELRPPYVIAVGDFLPDHPGEEIAVAERRQRRGDGTVEIYGVDGRRLAQTRVESPMDSQAILIARRDGQRCRPLLYLQDARQGVMVDLENQSTPRIELADFPIGATVGESAFDVTSLLAGVPEPLHSTLIERSNEGVVTRHDAGREENRFFIALQTEFEQELGELAGKAEAQHIEFGVYGHLRTEGVAWHPLHPDRPLAQARQQAAEETLSRFRANTLKDLNDQPMRMWNPCFTHRQMKQPFAPFARATDPRTGLPAYVMLGRTGAFDGQDDWEGGGFFSGTYALSIPRIEALYVTPLRTFLRHFAPLYRAAPHRVPSIEPNHEHEIVVSRDQSIGDYNPAMIDEFFAYLLQQYGSLPAIQQSLGTDFASHFDAPRNLERGAWDAYSEHNPFFNEWVQFNRRTVNRVVMTTYREALLAGLPPQMIYCHQIPDIDAVPLVPGLGTSERISPIDWPLVSGAGFGFTRFGMYSRNPQNIQAAAQSSGHDSMAVGEMQPLTIDPEQAYLHLRWMFDHGARAVHILYWSPHHGSREGERDAIYNRTIYDAVQRLVREDPPRPGQTGGIGQIRPFRDAKRTFQVAVVGAGPQHTGLIKSLNADGSMEGTVYVVPFRAHVEVHELAVHRPGEGALRVGPVGALDVGTQIEVTARATSQRHAGLRWSVSRHGVELPGMAATIDLEPGTRSVRLALRVMGPIDGLAIDLTGDPHVGFPDALATRQAEQSARVHQDRRMGERHRGGVTFAILD